MLNEHSKVPVAYREPFAFGAQCWVDYRRHGETVFDMVLSVPKLPAGFLSWGIVCINGEVVPREMWAHVRPKPTSNTLPIAVTMHWPLQSPGGGRGGLKSVVGIVAAIALVVVTAGIATGAIPFLVGAGFAGGSFEALALAGAVGILGSLAIAALTRPPVQALTQDVATSGADAASGGGTKESAGAGRNVLQRGGSIPRVIGRRKIFPPFACEPLVEIQGTDTEVVELMCVLNGPHSIEDIRVDGSPVDGAEDIEYEVRFGLPAEDDIEIIDRTGITLTPNLRMSQHLVQNDNFTLGDQSQPDDCLPVFHAFVTRPDADRVWLHLNFPSGLTNPSGDDFQIPFRIRMRERGGDEGDWRDFPEIHFSNSTTNQLRSTIEFRWIADFGDPPSDVPSNNGWIFAITQVPPQTNGPGTPSERQWDSDGYFFGSGDGYLSSSNESTSGLINVDIGSAGATFWLAESGTPLPRGPAYEIEIKRGCPFFSDGFSQNGSYSWTPAPFGGVVNDFFWYYNSGNLLSPVNSSNVAHQVVISRVVSVFQEGGDPVYGDGFAKIAIKARNRQIGSISCIASGLVKDWNGTAWDSALTTTSNPATNYVDVLRGSLNFDPLELDLLDNAVMLEWRTLCDTNAWTCDAIIDDMRTQDVLDLLASCGYARPYQSETYGVTIDKNRSGDSPIQVFSSANSRSFLYERAFARVPEGLLITYRNEDLDDDQAQIVVSQRDPSIGVRGFFENAAYDGLVDTAKVVARGQFDLDQANLRSTFYSLETDIESIVCRRGDLIAVQHDILTSRSGTARIVSKTLSAGNIIGVILDSEIQVLNPIDMHTIADMHVVGDLRGSDGGTGLSIRRSNGTISTHKISNAEGSTSTITFTTPFADTAQVVGFNDTDNKQGCLIVSGNFGQEYLRLLVANITPGKDLTAALVLVDEAQALVRYAP